MDGSPESQNTTVDYPSWLQPYIQNTLDRAQTAFNAGPPDVYPGQTYADFTPSQIKGQEYGTNFADQFSSNFAPTMGAYSKALSGENPYAKYVEGGNPYLDQMVTRANQNVADVFNRDVMQNIRDESIGSGQQIGSGQSTYNKGVDVGTENLLRQMGDMTTSMYGGAYESDMNRLLAGEQTGIDAMMKGLSLSPSIMSTQMMPSQIYSQVGGEQQALDQAGINEMIKRWYEPYTSEVGHLQDFAGMFSGLSPGGTTSTTTDGGSNPWAQAIGSGAMGYGAASMMGASNPWLYAGAAALPYIWK